MTNSYTTPIKLDVQEACYKSDLYNHDRDIITANLISQIIEIPEFVQEVKNCINDHFIDFLYSNQKLARLPWAEQCKAKEELERKAADDFFTSIYDEIIEVYNKYADEKVEALLEEDRYQEAA
jgi:hypothetical protein